MLSVWCVRVVGGGTEGGVPAQCLPCPWGACGCEGVTLVVTQAAVAGLLLVVVGGVAAAVAAAVAAEAAAVVVARAAKQDAAAAVAAAALAHAVSQEQQQQQQQQLLESCSWRLAHHQAHPLPCVAGAGSGAVRARWLAARAPLHREVQDSLSLPVPQQVFQRLLCRVQRASHPVLLWLCELRAAPQARSCMIYEVWL